MCRRGRENLRAMKKDTFKVAADPEAKDECNKNHKESTSSASNDSRIYEIPGKTNHHNFTCRHFKNLRLHFIKKTIHDG